MANTSNENTKHINFIPVYIPYLNGNEKKYVEQCLQTTWISSKGKYIQIFQQKFSEFTGIKYSCAVSNGTTALHTALLACNIQSGDEVIVPTFTYIATVNAITYTGATPVFIDSNIRTWQINVDDIQKNITKKTKAILIVHLYGQPCQMDRIYQICDKYNLLLIEDCAQAINSKYKDIHVGNFGNIATFSFFGNKTITTGQGGMVCSNDDKIIQYCKRIKGQGLSSYKQYWHDIIGYNYRMTNIQAAIGVAQLQNISEILQMKLKIWQTYKNYLITVYLQQTEPNTFNNFWMINILCKNLNHKESVVNELKNHNIETRPFFNLVSQMPMYLSHEKFPNAKYLSEVGLTLPSYPGLSQLQIKYICEVINEVK